MNNYNNVPNHNTKQILTMLVKHVITEKKWVDAYHHNNLIWGQIVFPCPLIYVPLQLLQAISVPLITYNFRLQTKWHASGLFTTTDGNFHMNTYKFHTHLQLELLRFRWKQVMWTYLVLQNFVHIDESGPFEQAGALAGGDGFRLAARRYQVGEVLPLLRAHPRSL